MAGYMGCFNLTMHPSRLTNLASASTFESDYKTMVGGNEASAGTWSPVLNATIGNGGHAPLAGSDVLVVRLPSGRSVPLSDAMATTSVPIPLANAASMAGFTVGGLAVVSDCAYANVFAVTGLAAANKLEHAGGLNTDLKLTRAFSNVQRATVTPITTVTYFVANASNGVAGSHALWRQEGSKLPEEVADGVEQMQIEYGIDTDAVRDALVNRFVTADQVGAFPVVAVKVSLLLRSSDDKVVRTAQKYTFDGVTGITPTDRRLYTPFTTTVALRNRGDQ